MLDYSRASSIPGGVTATIQTRRDVVTANHSDQLTESGAKTALFEKKTNLVLYRFFIDPIRMHVFRDECWAVIFLLSSAVTF